MNRRYLLPWMAAVAGLLLNGPAWAQQSPAKPESRAAAAALLARTASQNAREPRTAPDVRVITGNDAFTFAWGVPDIRLDLDLNNVGVREALERVFDQAKQEFALDADVPADARITLRAKQVRFATALDLITQAAGVRWTQQSQDGKRLYRVGKSPQASSFFPNGVWSSSVRPNFAVTLPRNNFVFGTAGGATDIPLDLSFNKTPWRDAVRQTLSWAGLTMELVVDSDVEASAPVTWQGTDTTLGRALNFLAQSVQSGWRFEQKNDKPVLRFGKTLPRSFFSGLTTQVYGNALAQLNGNNTPFVFRANTEAENQRLDLDLNNVGVREALERVFDQAKQEFALDADVPADARITLRAKQVRFATALDLITQAAGVRWRREMRDGKMVYRIGKAVGPAGALGITSVTGFVPSNLPETHVPLQTLDAGALYSYATTRTEQRSTFTCPHCKAQVVVLPSGGGARSSNSPVSTWKFCPVCGRAIPSEPATMRR